ncbi:MAG: murein L,D-transpeptidase catalytic domain-containing protein [Ferruginibacter sp.]
MFNCLKPAAGLLPACVILCSVTSFTPHKNRAKYNLIYPAKKNSANAVSLIGRLRSKALETKAYARIHNFNTDFCLMADMGIAPGKKRFFMYSFINDSVELSGLVTHGMGRNRFSGEIEFSNLEGSLCTSLGKYKIGNYYTGNYGPAYKLHGLDETNSNAFKRAVVLHGYDCVPEEEVYPKQICKSEGCPMLSPVFFQQLKTFLNQSEKPVLLLIYN